MKRPILLNTLRAFEAVGALGAGAEQGTCGNPRIEINSRRQ